MTFYLEEDEEEEAGHVEKGIDKKIDEALLKSRRVFLSTQVDQESAKDIIRKLWFLEMHDPGKPILFIINSPGGSVDCGFAIWDQIKMITSPVATLVTGLAASMGSLLSLVAEKGQRYATPRSRIMIHQPRISGVIRGQATDLEIQAQEIIKTRAELVEIYVEATGKPAEEVENDLDRDRWLNAKEALEYGLLDKIVTDYKSIGF
ncbi:MAG: ATP-dependent Clp protease proteolytic subunit [Rhabdochlamydiaceae bacterium]|nr:ATP-dependent Clp protease proteolytic subunit [Candidatus Amphrikana amoebophyrae]